MMRHIIEASDLFLGVLPDGEHRLIKGSPRLDLIAAGIIGSPPLRFMAAEVQSESEAIYFRHLYGDAADHPRSRSETRVHAICQE